MPIGSSPVAQEQLRPRAATGLQDGALQDARLVDGDDGEHRLLLLEGEGLQTSMGRFSIAIVIGRSHNVHAHVLRNAVLRHVYGELPDKALIAGTYACSN